MADHITLWGAGLFGVVIGWYVYYVNRYRRGDIQMTDIVTLIGAIGGASILRLFNAGTDLFGAYGIGLAAGFFAYFLVLIILVAVSATTQGSFNFEWFLDGRRRNPQDPWAIPAGAAETRHPFEVRAAALARAPGAGTIHTGSGGEAGYWQSLGGKDIDVRVTINNAGKCPIIGVPTDSNGLQRGFAVASPGTSSTVSIAAVSRILFSCQGDSGGEDCVGSWTVDPIS